MPALAGAMIGARREGTIDYLLMILNVCEVAGFTSYSLGARHSVAVSAVLGSQFAAFAALAAFVLFRERLRLAQIIGITVIAVCVALLSAIRA